MILGIDPKVDFAFKYMFGRESTRGILIDVLNKVLEPSAGHEIQDVELLNPFTIQESPDDKFSVLDIKARDKSGRQFNVEMQMLAFPHYEKRILYYWSNLYGEQLYKGDEYAVLRPTISISFLNHVLFPQVPDYHLRFHLLEERHHFAMTRDVEFHILELPKFTKSLAELESGLDLWLYFLRFAEKIDTEALPTALRQPGIVQALEVLKMLTQTDIERERYKAREKALHRPQHLDGLCPWGRSENRSENRSGDWPRDRPRKIGQEIGQKIGAIHAYERLLHRPITPKEQLLALPTEDLTRLAQDLEMQALKRLMRQALSAAL